MRIGYLTDPVKGYVDGVRAATTLAELQAHIRKHRRIAVDALCVADRMTAEDFVEFRKGLPKVRRPFKGFELWTTRYGALVLPIVMLEVSMIADQFKAPWGCAFIRAKEEGLIVERDGLAYMAMRKPKKGTA
jgi:hypothetical protein